MRKRKVLVVCQDSVGAKVAGPAIRSLQFACQLAKRFDVTLLLISEPQEPLDLPSVTVVVHEPHFRWMERFARRFDLVLSQPLRMHVQHAVKRSGTPVIYDMYVPSIVETLSSQASETGVPQAQRRHAYTRTRLDALGALSNGSAFLCASERQRDLWLGALGTIGRFDIDSYTADPSYRSLIGIAPFGLSEEPPEATRPVMRGVLEGVDEGSFILLWAGGIWNWFDPLTVIDAVARLRERLPQLRLVFLGTQHPNAEIRMQMTQRAIDRVRDRGLGDVVHFLEGWVPYDERASYLLEADVGVAAHFDSVESRFSFRTRFLDHIWAELPTITTQGSPLSDLIEAAGIGVTVADEDVDAWVEAIEMLSTNRERMRQMSDATASLQESFSWTAIGERLSDFVERTLDGPVRPTISVKSRMPRYLWVQVRLQGGVQAARKLAKTVFS